MTIFVSIYAIYSQLWFLHINFGYIYQIISYDLKFLGHFVRFWVIFSNVNKSIFLRTQLNVLITFLDALQENKGLYNSEIFKKTQK